MDLCLILVLCLFAALGVVQAVGWAIEALYRPKRPCGVCRVTETYGCTLQDIEALIRFHLVMLHWHGGHGALIIVDDAQFEAAEEIAGQLLTASDPILLCRPHDVPELLRYARRTEWTP